MKQITKQFQKLAPKWFEELKTSLKYKQKARNPKLNIGDARCCIVGEIHGFSNCYNEYNGGHCYCYDCDILSIKLAYESPLKHDSPLIIKLIDHINKSHPELMEGKKC